MRVLFKRFSSYRAVNTVSQTYTREVPTSNLDWKVHYPDTHLSALSLFLQVRKGAVLPNGPILFLITLLLLTPIFLRSALFIWMLHRVDL